MRLRLLKKTSRPLRASKSRSTEDSSSRSAYLVLRRLNAPTRAKNIEKILDLKNTHKKVTFLSFLVILGCEKWAKIMSHLECVQKGPSFGKSQLLNGSNFGKSKQKQNGAKIQRFSSNTSNTVNRETTF